ncbi:MAG: precorrin-6A/cobalt-precorrin-6A reductase, partial [Lachnospiraceae bacterium]|nr:precorrin-6A/cobalt-precorrin-6A reductase [Lachnospiraceae bacterium]
MDNLKDSEYRQKKILVFGGTIEGRQVSDYLCERNAAHTVCVATEYGEEVLRPRKQDFARMDVRQMEVHQGRMDRDQICEFLRNASYTLVVDATHPYAVEVSKNIREACQIEQVPYIRYLREDGAGIRTEDAANSSEETMHTMHDASAEKLIAQEENQGIDMDHMSCDGFAPVYVDSTWEAAQYLETRQGRIFLTTGSKELPVFIETISDPSRLFVRVLPSAEVIASCRSLGLEGKQICAMQGPFSLEMNTAMLRQTGCTYLVTKETGASGGFPEKMEAARACQAVAVVIRRPHETGSCWEKVKDRLDAAAKAIRIEALQREMAALDHEDLEEDCDEDDSCYDTPRRISCIGIGMGTPWTLTCEAVHEIQKAQALFGAERMLECVYSLFGLHDYDGDLSAEDEHVSNRQTEIEHSSSSVEDSGGGLMDPSMCADQPEDLSGRSFRGPFQIRFADEREEERGYPAMVPEYRADKI